MSYSVIQKCGRCKRQSTCSDGVIIQQAVNTIHSIGVDRGHEGMGCITHDCTNFVDETEGEKTSG